MKELKGNKFNIYIATKIRNRFISEAMSYLNRLKKEYKDCQKNLESISPSFSSAFCLTTSKELLIMQKAFMDILLISDAKWWKSRRRKSAHDIITEYLEQEDI